MKANESKVEDFLSSNKTQYIIPVYQRNYDWSVSQCKQLLDDIFEVGRSSSMNAHFIGSIVYVHDDVYTSTKIKELTIIDGQQRLTTLMLIYLSIYRLAMKMGEESLTSEIRETYLINKFAQEDQKLKLRPSEDNSKALKYLLRNDDNEDFADYSKIIDNFNYFKGRIVQENYQFVLDGLSKLMFVEISLDRHKDDPQRIFESLNSTGLELSQADLIRNYILMRLSRKDQYSIYQNYWEVIERLAKDESRNISRVSEFMRDYLTIINKNIPNKGKVYLEFKDRYPTTTVAELEKNLSDMKALVRHYNKLINPNNEADKDLRIELEYINRLEINVAFPFLMKVYNDYSASIIDKKEFLKVLTVVQSFTWRRFILGLPTNALNKIFMSLYEKIDIENYVYSVEKYLLQRSGTMRFPKDSEIREALRVKDLYNIKSKNRTYFLEKLENFENTERVTIENNPDITIEHIFPKNPDPKWKVDLGNDAYTTIKESYLDTIANLTLSGNNGKLGNKPFKYKRDLKGAGYKDSRLWMNKYLSNLEKWDEEEIDKRFKLIAGRFFKIWEYPKIDITTAVDNGEVNIFEAEDPKHKKLEYAIFFDQRLEITQVSKLYTHVFKALFDLQPETLFSTEIGERIGLSKTPKELGIRQAVPINDTYFIEGNMDNASKFDRIKQALKVFDFEEELIIKYAKD